MHVILAIPIIIGTIYILTMTTFGRWLSAICIFLFAICIVSLFATGLVSYHTAPQYQSQSESQVESRPVTTSRPTTSPSSIDHNCDDIIKNIGKFPNNPDIEKGQKILIGIMCPTRPEGIPRWR